MAFGGGGGGGFGFRKILCIQSVGLISFISSIVNPKTLLYSLKTLNNLLISILVKDALIITGYVSLGPRKAYLRFEGRDLRSTFGASYTFNDGDLISNASTSSSLKIVASGCGGELSKCCAKAAM